MHLEEWMDWVVDPTDMNWEGLFELHESCGF